MLYSISADLKSSFSKENLNHILENGSKIGFHYYEYGPETEFATLELAAEGLMKPNVYDAIGIMVKKNDTLLSMSIDYTSDSFGIVIGGFDINDINIIECTRQFLYLIGDFRLLEIYTMYH